MKNEYSQKEQDMFAALGYTDLMDSIDPIGLYNMAARRVFEKNIQGAAAQSLRRTSKAISDSSPYRNTPQFDNLIKLGGLDANPWFGSDDKIWGTDFVYCNQHLRVHSTGWCTVSCYHKVPLLGKTLEESQKEWEYRCSANGCPGHFDPSPTYQEK